MAAGGLCAPPKIRIDNHRRGFSVPMRPTVWVSGVSEWADKQLAAEQMPEQHKCYDEQHAHDDAVENAVHPAAHLARQRHRGHAVGESSYCNRMQHANMTGKTKALSRPLLARTASRWTIPIRRGDAICESGDGEPWDQPYRNVPPGCCAHSKCCASMGRSMTETIGCCGARLALHPMRGNSICPCLPRRCRAAG